MRVLNRFRGAIVGLLLAAVIDPWWLAMAVGVVVIALLQVAEAVGRDDGLDEATGAIDRWMRRL